MNCLYVYYPHEIKLILKDSSYELQSYPLRLAHIQVKQSRFSEQYFVKTTKRPKIQKLVFRQHFCEACYSQTDSGSCLLFGPLCIYLLIVPDTRRRYSAMARDVTPRRNQLFFEPERVQVTRPVTKWLTPLLPTQIRLLFSITCPDFIRAAVTSFCVTGIKRFMDFPNILSFNYLWIR